MNMNLYMRSGNVIVVPLPDTMKEADISYKKETDGSYSELTFNPGLGIYHFTCDPTAIEAIIIA
ncbi:MAG: hypothetical protein LC650_00300 [Actinobacteria bacterium]|nr:hypothetical protein [Actinomycetota bacterium]